MDYNTYKQKFFADPAPSPRWSFTGAFGVTLFYKDFKAAVDYYTAVLGPSAYVEGHGTRGWRIGAGWLTLLQGAAGNPTNVEITFTVSTLGEAEALQQAFIAAGGAGEPPSNQLMYAPVRFCPVVDPFGVALLIISTL